MMHSTTQPLLFILFAALLSACTTQPHTGKSAQSTLKPKPSSAMITPPPPKPFGPWTVEDVLQDYGPMAQRKMQPYFAKAQVPYPPREITLIALKAEKKLEVWARGEGEFRFIRDYPIQAASGVAGPKLLQGDRQVPEGIYHIVGFNPNSNYHLSMKLDYPNEFDRYHADQEGRFDPGSDIFIHGRAKSIGCLAMGDEAIEELFVLTAQVGKENAKVVIAPHDPRKAPLEYEGDGLPGWTPELYGMISREVNKLSTPVKVSNKTSLPQTQPVLKR